MKAKPGIELGRRQILRGVGGFTLAIPFLSSLEKNAAAAPLGGPRPRLFWIGTDHGGASEANMFPADSVLQTTGASGVAGHSVKSGTLAGTASGNSTMLSPILKASSASLTARLIGKMNVLRGLDVPFYIAHNTGLHLGNYARNNNDGDDGRRVSQMGMRPTIDQIIANSPSFYSAADLTSTKLRSMVINPNRQMSWAFSNPAQGVASPVQNSQGSNSSVQLFNRIFDGTDKGPAARPPIVDKVLASYNSLRQSNTRLSAADRVRLDTHMAMLAELQTSLNARISCGAPPKPTDDAKNHPGLTPDDAKANARLWADVVAAAFACGASRIGTFGWGDTAGFSSYRGSDWHGDAAHMWNTPQGQAYLAESYQGFFEHAFLYLAAKLDALDDGNGQSVLDNTLMAWTQESCWATHDSYSVPVVTFGKGGGYFKTGLYCDYRKVGGVRIVNNGMTTYPGLLYNQWLGNVLLAMGLSPAEFELWKDSNGQTQKGYGTAYCNSYYAADYNKHYGDTSSAYFTMASSPLPFIVQ